MNTLMEFKNIKRSWMNITFDWIKSNGNIQNETINWNRDIKLKDIEGLAAKIAYSMYKEEHMSKDLELISELPNEEHLLFINFLKQQGITAEFTHNLKKFRQMEIQQYLITLEEKTIDLEYGIYMGFPWNFKGIMENSGFWEYHSNAWKRKLTLFRGKE